MTWPRTAHVLFVGGVAVGVFAATFDYVTRDKFGFGYPSFVIFYMYAAMAGVYTLFLYKKHRFFEYIIVSYCVLTGIHAVSLAMELLDSGWSYGSRWYHMTADNELRLASMYRVTNSAWLVSGLAIAVSPLPVLFRDLVKRGVRGPTISE